VSPIAITLPASVLPGAPYAFPPAAVQPHPNLHQVNMCDLSHMILDDNNSSIANMSCFGAFADAHAGVVYSDLTDDFPFISFDGRISFLEMYHYEYNAILLSPISGLDDLCIFNVYKKSFDKLSSKGFKPKLNVTDNQATKFIRKFLTKKKRQRQLFGATQPSRKCRQVCHPDI
jgi:hypothetical protein